MLRLIDINTKSESYGTVRNQLGPIQRPQVSNIKANCTTDPVIDRFIYNLKSIWLFTYSDLKTIIIPSTFFAALHLLASESLGLEKTSTTFFHGILRACFWAWLNLLPFTIDNQRQPCAIKEDGINKSWRTFPSNRMSPETGRSLMFFFYGLAIVISYYFNGLPQCLILIGLGFAYNDLGAADKSCLLRNFINGLGFVCYTSGALQVSLGSNFNWSPRLIGWFGLIGGVVFTTVQTQDMYDQPGDAERGRATVPLVIGDSASRWCIAIPMIFWSWFCPWYWNVPIFGLGGLSAILAWIVAGRTLTRRSISQDKKTFLIWNAWMVSLYSLPLGAIGG